MKNVILTNVYKSTNAGQHPIAVRLRLKALYINSVGHRPTNRIGFIPIKAESLASNYGWQHPANCNQDVALSGLRGLSFCIVGRCPTLLNDALSELFAPVNLTAMGHLPTDTFANKPKQSKKAASTRQRPTYMFANPKPQRGAINIVINYKI